MNILNSKHDEHPAIHLAFKISKLVLKAAGVVAAFCLVNEVHNVHKAIERNHKK